MTTLNVNTIEEAKAQYDAEVRRLLAQKPILARVLLGTMGELEGMTPEEVEARIEGKPDVAGTPVSPGSAIAGGASEDVVPGEGTVRFDIRTSVNVSGETGPVRVIVNVEAQRNYSPGYEIVTRGVFYASRLIGAQLGVEFEHSDYDSVKKVYSIWICMNAPKDVGNAISSYAFSKRDHLGRLPDRPAAYDKAEVVVIALDREKVCDNDLVGMLNLVLSPNVSKKRKVEDLEGRYNIPVRGDVAEGVNVMCNLSDYVMEYAIERGMAQGMERGMRQGMQQGMERGAARELNRRNTELVISNLKRGLSYEQVAEFLSLSVAEVKDLEQNALALA